MPYSPKSFGTNLQFFIKHVLENKCDEVTFVDNILTTDNIKNFINKWNEITGSNISYASLIRNFCNYNIKCIQKKSKFSYQFPPNFKLNEKLNRTKSNTKNVTNDKKIAFIKTIPIAIFQILKGKGGLDYSGFIKTVKLTTEEESIINNTEIIINLYDNGLIH